MTVRFGLLGAGRIGKVHAKAITSSPKAKLVAVADAFEKAAQPRQGSASPLPAVKPAPSPASTPAPVASPAPATSKPAVTESPKPAAPPASVAAKPAEQTPAVAQAFVALLHAAGVPTDALALLHGPGETVGAALVAHPHCAGVCFTGSTQVAKIIQRALAAQDGPIVPLIAETGGLNAMIVDSTALPEQVADAVVQSAFRSAGQRCSALRLLCVHEGIADGVVEMIRGAMAELRLGDPARFDTDVGPVIDAAAQAGLARHIQRLRQDARLVGEVAWSGPGHFVAPVAFEIGRIADLKEEVFGPVLHIVRWSGDVGQVMAQVNALGYGLTFGIQTRIDSRARRLAEAARIGNVYVNRNMIGAVVGVQPFGGEGLSGTGPKAGGPHYLYRFCAEQTVTINTTAAGGNVGLLAGPALHEPGLPS